MSLQIGDRVTCTHFSGMYFVVAHVLLPSGRHVYRIEGLGVKGWFSESSLRHYIATKPKKESSP